MRDTYPKHIYGNKNLSKAEINNLASKKVKAALGKKDNEIFNKKNEVCQLREQVKGLKLLIGMIGGVGNIENALFNLRHP